MPEVRRTRATLRRAEFGFFGVVVYTRVQTPRRWGEPFSAGVLFFSTLSCRPFRTSCWIVGTVSPFSVCQGLVELTCGMARTLRPTRSGVLAFFGGRIAESHELRCGYGAHRAGGVSAAAADLLARTRTRAHPRHKVRAYLAHRRRSKQRGRARVGPPPGAAGDRAPAQPEDTTSRMPSTQPITDSQPRTRPSTARPSPSSRVVRSWARARWPVTTAGSPVRPKVSTVRQPSVAEATARPLLRTGGGGTKTGGMNVCGTTGTGAPKGCTIGPDGRSATSEANCP